MLEAAWAAGAGVHVAGAGGAGPGVMWRLVGREVGTGRQVSRVMEALGVLRLGCL